MADDAARLSSRRGCAGGYGTTPRGSDHCEPPDAAEHQAAECLIRRALRPLAVELACSRSMYLMSIR